MSVILPGRQVTRLVRRRSLYIYIYIYIYTGPSYRSQLEHNNGDNRARTRRFYENPLFFSLIADHNHHQPNGGKRVSTDHQNLAEKNLMLLRCATVNA